MTQITLCSPLSPCFHHLSLPSLSKQAIWRPSGETLLETLKAAGVNHVKENLMNHSHKIFTYGVTARSNTTLDLSCNCPCRNPSEEEKNLQHKEKERHLCGSEVFMSLLVKSWWGHERAAKEETCVCVCVRKAVFYPSIQGWHDEVVLYTWAGSLKRKLIDARIVL